MKKLSGSCEHCPDSFRGVTGITERAQGSGLIAFGKAIPVFVENKPVMMPFGHGQLKKFLEKPMDVGGCEEIKAPGHDRNILRSVINGDGEMIGSGDIPARQHNVSRCGEIDGLIPSKLVMPR